MNVAGCPKCARIVIPEVSGYEFHNLSCSVCRTRMVGTRELKLLRLRPFITVDPQIAEVLVNRLWRTMILLMFDFTTLPLTQDFYATIRAWRRFKPDGVIYYPNGARVARMVIDAAIRATLRAPMSADNIRMFNASSMLVSAWTGPLRWMLLPDKCEENILLSSLMISYYQKIFGPVDEDLMKDIGVFSRLVMAYDMGDHMMSILNAAEKGGEYVDAC